MDSNMEITTKSAEETQNFGKKFASQLKGGEILALVGDLGSGKTTFVQGLAEGLGIKDKIISPTFLLMREYKIENLKWTLHEMQKIENLYHVDLYRLEDDLEQELERLGIKDVWGKSENLVVIEWADKVRAAIPENATWIKFEQEGEMRKITID